MCQIEDALAPRWYEAHAIKQNRACPNEAQLHYARQGDRREPQVRLRAISFTNPSPSNEHSLTLSL